MDTKYIFMDLDGTLRGIPDNIVTQATREGMQKARDNGHKLFLCTGRNLPKLEEVKDLPLDGIVGGAGTIVTVGDEIIYDVGIEGDEFWRVYGMMRACGLICDVETTWCTYIDMEILDFFDARKKEADAKGVPSFDGRKIFEKELETGRVKPMSMYQGEPVHKIGFSAWHRRDVYPFRDVYGKDYRIVFYDGMMGKTDLDDEEMTSGEINPFRFDKGQGCRVAVEYFGGDMKDSIGFGDSMNDYEMIEACAVGVVMENGEQGLKDIADVIAGEAGKEGVLHEFERMGLI